MSKSAFDLSKSAATLLAALARGGGASSRHREADAAALVAADLAQREAGGLVITQAGRAHLRRNAPDGRARVSP